MAIYTNNYAIQYLVRYFNGLEMKEVYFYRTELSEEVNSQKPGFVKIR